MLGEKWTIYWSEYSADAYTYGSEIFFHKKDHVEFVNSLMPPGTVVKQWYSKTNFQTQRIEPTLPIIDGESEYRLTLNYEVPDGQTCLVRLVFYDRFGVEAGSLTVRDPVTDFRCPLKTYSYRVQLINGGMTRVNFHSIVIQEVINETETEDQSVKKNRKKSKKL